MSSRNTLPADQLLNIFKKEKVAISLAITSKFPLVHGLKDHGIITETEFVDLQKDDRAVDEVIYDLLDKLENKGMERIKLFLEQLFRKENSGKYPELGKLKTKFNEFIYEENASNARTPKRLLMTNRKRKCPVKKKRTKLTDGIQNDDSEEPGTSGTKTGKLQHGTTAGRRREKEKSTDVNFSDNRLPVTCGIKEGMLYKEKFVTGKPCIEANGNWFTPSSFEDFGGRKHSRNWKKTITCGRFTLEKLIQLKYLTQPKKGGSIKSFFPVSTRRMTGPLNPMATPTPPPSPPTFQSGSSSGPVPPSITIQSPGREVVTGEISLELRQLFASEKFPVSCGAVTGVLYKCRFATGSFGKCIRTEKKWCTPWEFLELDAEIGFASWDKDIRTKGISLCTLIEKSYLKLHKDTCVCMICTSGNSSQENDDECSVCSDGGHLICCENCVKAFHKDCHIPTPPLNIEDDMMRWYCTFCKMEKSQEGCLSNKTENEESQVLKVLMTPKHYLKCEFLLLKLYCEDESLIFAKNPTHTIQNYSSYIEKPMWLDHVKQKLFKKKYNTVESFVQDIRLIFKNCRTFNKENEFGKLGVQLSTSFENNLRNAFAIKSQTHNLN
uniref:Nuclear body protein SP140-like protein n=1 Tax=Geotrypetes seraphini TaxID=260995 RepID=A0A6P8S9C5_GEOSA|nr:nuclear body protein SP140-like protein [Geotrypetes seraphini]